MPFVEVVVNDGIVAPEQNGPTCVKVGVVFGVTVIVLVTIDAQSPAVGVNV